MLELTKEERARIRDWLDLSEIGKTEICPLGTLHLGTLHCKTVCKKMFPKIRTKSWPSQCPCFVYTMKHVTRTAQRALKGELKCQNK